MGLKDAAKAVVGGVKAAMVELRNGRHDAEGFEHLDNTPVAVPVGYGRPESLTEIIARLMVNNEFRRSLNDHGVETEDEANDFDIPGDEMILTPFEEAGDEELDKLIAIAKSEQVKRETERFRQKVRDQSHGGDLRVDKGSEDVGSVKVEDKSFARGSVEAREPGVKA